MKKLYTLLAAVILTSTAFAQAPEKMSYQAVVRDAGNALVTGQAVGMQISILQGSASGTAVYVETQTPNTNINGLVSIEIGSGTFVSGAFNTIDWSSGTYFIKTETDPTGGTNYTITGTSQLMSVPYALYAKTSGSSTPGPQGPIGLTGLQGLKGDTGAVGPQGPIGLTGPQGLKGDTGVAGIQGIQGIQGLKGDTGAVGPQGPIGLTGLQGLKGDTGAVGPQGLIGLTGLQGLKGDTGVAGPQGLIGLTGATGTFTSGTVAGEMNYWNGTAWVTVTPGFTGQSLTYCGGVPTWGPCPVALNIGDTAHGGIVAYILQSGDPGYNANLQHGLIAAPSDQSTGIFWGCPGNVISGADGTAIGTGAQNTIDIIADCSALGIAARLCGNLVLGGYSDWFLPSQDELNKLYLNRGAIGGFASQFYWSSTELNLNYAWRQIFTNGYQGDNYKNSTTNYVRAVRAF